MSLRAFTMACAAPWAIQPEALRQILEIATREHIPDFDAVDAKRARRLDGTDSARVRDGVAIVSVVGPIVRYADFFSDISGATSITTLSRDFNAALTDPNVRAIVLSIDSPGGEVAGVNEFAQMIFDARGRKPIVAYVDGMAASAAYWIASAADEIVADATALLGSIGVIATVPNPGARSAKEINFVSSQSPKKRPDPTTESGKDQMQDLVDRLADVFVETVARNRDVSVDTVLSDFGQGAVFVGRNAIAAGLADRLGNFEGVVAELAAGWSPKRKKMAAAAAEGGIDMGRFERIRAGLQDLMRIAAGGDGEQAEPAAEPTQTKGEPATDPATEADPAAQPAAEPAAEPATDASALATTGSGDRPDPVADEAARLREELAIAKAHATRQAIESFIAEQSVAGRILPVEAEGLRDELLQAAADDLIMPLPEGSRLERKKAAVAGRAAHGLFDEKIVDGRHRVLHADANQQTEFDPAREAELLGMTALGKKALDTRKGLRAVE